MDISESLPSHPQGEFELPELQNVLELLVLLVGQDLVPTPVDVEKLQREGVATDVVDLHSPPF